MKITIEIENTSELEEARDLLGKLCADEDTEQKRAMLRPIQDLDFTVRTKNCLLDACITTLGGLLGNSEVDLLKLPNMGMKSVTEIKDVLATRGYRLR